MRAGVCQHCGGPTSERSALRCVECYKATRGQGRARDICEGCGCLTGRKGTRRCWECYKATIPETTQAALILRLRELAATDIRRCEAARQLGITSGRISGLCRRHGIHFRAPERAPSKMPKVRVRRRAPKHTLPPLTLVKTAPSVPEKQERRPMEVKTVFISPSLTCEWLEGEDRWTWKKCERRVTLKLDGTPSSYCPEHHARCYRTLAQARAEREAA